MYTYNALDVLFINKEVHRDVNKKLSIASDVLFIN